MSNSHRSPVLKSRSNSQTVSEIEPVYFTKDDLSLFLEKLRDNYLHSIWFQLLFTFGMTISELINLRVRDVNLDEQTLMIQTSRNHISRKLKIPPSILPSLRLETIQRHDEELLFNGRKGKLCRRTVQKIFEKIHISTGIKVTVPKLRKSTALHLKAKGWSEKSIANYMGHASKRSTKRLLYKDIDEREDIPFPFEEITNSAA